MPDSGPLVECEGMSWLDATVHVIDFEGSRASGILEYGMVTIQGGLIRETHTRLCRPTGEIREEDVRTHGIRREEADRHEPFSREWDLFSGRRKTGPFAAHFAPVENSLIKSVWPYPGRSPDFTGLGGTTVEWGPWVDTGRLLPRLFEGLPGAGLSGLVEAFGCRETLDRLAGEYCPPERGGYHCALYDALGSALLLLKIAEFPQFRDRSLAWLLEMSAGSGDKGEVLRQRRLF